MFVNQYQINLSTLSSATTATTINIPINLEYQIVDQSEIIERVFVDIEVEKTINPIVDYEKTRFKPINSNNKVVNKITYELDLSGKTTYGSIGFTDDDIKFETERFKQTFLNLSFYDSDIPLTQNLLSFITLNPSLAKSDLSQSQSTTSNLVLGQTKPASEIKLTFICENPIINLRGKSNGYYLYDFKDELIMNGAPKSLYMKATFKNAKTGKVTNLMVNDKALPIEDLIKKLYTRYILTKTDKGFFYKIDTTYNTPNTTPPTPNNVTEVVNTDNITVKLYQILAT
jgi:hypothetical protein